MVEETLPDEFDDGATEVVDVLPKRRSPKLASVEEASNNDAGGRLSAMRKAGARHRQDFIIWRRPDRALKASLPHAPLFAALWRVWARKRALGEDDPGASIAEIAEEHGLEAKGTQHILNKLSHTGLVRSVVQHIGWRGTRAKYYPTDEGIYLFSLGETLGWGSSVQVGRSTKAWAGRSRSEPNNMFQFAVLIQGGHDPKMPLSTEKV